MNLMAKKSMGLTATVVNFVKFYLINAHHVTLSPIRPSFIFICVFDFSLVYVRMATHIKR